MECHGLIGTRACPRTLTLAKGCCWTMAMDRELGLTQAPSALVASMVALVCRTNGFILYGTFFACFQPVRMVLTLLRLFFSSSKQAMCYL